ncbi:N-acetyl-beta-glucosaminyl-glycoprotein 4-beta-N-acetylgalactosaminyltransferase 1 [Lampetra fluviatilis]
MGRRGMAVLPRGSLACPLKKLRKRARALLLLLLLLLAAVGAIATWAAACAEETRGEAGGGGEEEGARGVGRSDSVRGRVRDKTRSGGPVSHLSSPDRRSVPPAGPHNRVDLAAMLASRGPAPRRQEEEGGAPAPWSPDLLGGANMHVYEDWCGASVAQLRKNLHFPLYPHSRSVISKLAVSPRWVNYGLRIFGYVVPTATGLYQFAVTSDDNSELWLSRDAAPANATLVASVGPTGREWTAPGEFRKFSSQISRPTRLVSSQRYFFELLHKQDDKGTDHVMVAWSRLGARGRFRTVDSRHLSLYADERGLHMDETGHVPLTPGGLGGPPPRGGTSPSPKHPAAMLAYSPQDTFFTVPLLDERWLAGGLPGCAYKPTYTIRGHPLLRYQGLQFVYLSYVYPNDFTRLAHMESENACVYEQRALGGGAAGGGPHGVDFSRYMKVDAAEAGGQENASTQLPRPPDAERRAVTGRVTGRTAAVAGGDRGCDGPASWDRSARAARTGIRAQEAPTAGARPSGSRPPRGCGAQGPRTSVSPGAPGTNGSGGGVRREEESASAGGATRRPRRDSNPDPEAGDTRGWLRRSGRDSRESRAPSSRSLLVLEGFGPEPNISARRGDLDRTGTRIGTSLLLGGGGGGLRAGGGAARPPIEPPPPSRAPAVATAAASRGPGRGGPGPSSAGPSERPGRGEAALDWGRTFAARGRVDVERARSDRIDLRCNVAGNALAPAREALAVARRFVQLLNARGGQRALRLRRAVAVEKRRDGARGGRYLLELEVEVKVGVGVEAGSSEAPVARLSQYVYATWAQGPLRRRGRGGGHVDGEDDEDDEEDDEEEEDYRDDGRLGGGAEIYEGAARDDDDDDAANDGGYDEEEDEDGVDTSSDVVLPVPASRARAFHLCRPQGFSWRPNVMVHFIVPVKNQARWVRQIIWDLEQLSRVTGDRRFSLVIADYDSGDMDIERALKASSLPSHQYVRLQGNFERSAALQAGADLVKDAHSVVFLCDLHLHFPWGLVDAVRRHCVEGRMTFAPMLMRLSCGSLPTEPDGYWEVNGFGLLGIYKSDFDRVGGMNTQEFRDRWGGEDWELLDRVLSAGLEVERLRLRNFYHHHHSHRGMWHRNGAAPHDRHGG